MQSAMEDFVLEARGLTKEFNGLAAVDDISFRIKRGEILGLLGPNGAGKTTTIMMLLGLIRPTKGEIKIFGMDFWPNREKILGMVNFSSAYSSLPARLTVFENLYVFANLYGIPHPSPRIRTLLENLELLDLKDQPTESLSSGEATRLNLCKALINDPQLLFLDEPTASLDPDIAQKVRELLFKIRRERDVSMLYTSHNMGEITQMCDTVIFLDKGKIVASGTPLNLTKMIEDSLLTVTFDGPLAEVKRFCFARNLVFQIPRPSTLEITTQEEKIGQILTQLAQEGITIADIVIAKPDLEDVFLKIARKT